MSEPEPSIPDLPERRLGADGWELLEEHEETLFGPSTVRVRGSRGSTRTARSGSVSLARPGPTASGGSSSRPARLRPAAAAGVGPATVWTEARRAFVETHPRECATGGSRPSNRGGRSASGGRSGGQARLQSFDARLPLGVDGVDAIDVEGWLGAWIAGGEFRLAGGAYPTDLSGLGAALGVEDEDLGPDVSACRTELLELLRAVE